MIWNISKGVLSTQSKRTKVTALMAAFLLTISSLASALAPFVQQQVSAAASGDVWVTAAMPDPAVGGTEYVKVKNNTAGSLSLDNWVVNDGSNYTISASSSLAAGAEATICPVGSFATPPCTPGYSITALGLNDTDDTITLKDSGDSQIDQVSYTAGQVTQGSEVAFSHTSSATTVSVCAAGCDYTALQDAIDNVADGGTVNLNGSLSVGSEVSVDKAITINGNGHTISPTFSGSGVNNSAIEIIGVSGVTISSLVIDGASGTSLHGINIYEASATLDGVTSQNNDKYGIVVNGSTVIVNNITTSGNSWGGIDVDLGSGVTNPATLTVNGTSSHAEALADIFVDDTTKSVTVNDTNSQYNHQDSGVTRAYELKPATPLCSSDDTTFDTSSLGSVNGQHGWSVANPNFDQEIVDNTYGYSSFGCKSLRLSNAYTQSSFGDQTFSYSTTNEAGEADSTNGGKSGGTRQNHYEAQFDIAAAKTAQQTGLAISVSPDRGDGSRMSYLRFEDKSDGIHVFFDDVPDSTLVGGHVNFTDSDIATLSRTDSHTIKFVIDYKDGPSNDIVKIYIDGGLTKTGTTWEDYYRYDSESSAEQTPRTSDSLLFRSAGTAAPATSGKGFLFDNVNVATSTISPDTTPPAVPSAVLTADNTGNNVPDNGTTNSEFFTFDLSASGDPARYQLKYWNDISGSSFKMGSPWNPTDLSGWSTVPSTLGVYKDHFTQGKGKHYFAFSACDAANNCSAYSSPFTVSYDNTPPATPTLTSPDDGVPINGTSPVANDWEGVSDADHYIYQSYNVDGSGNCILSPARFTGTYTDSQTNSRTLPDGLKFCWRVKAVDAAGNESGWSQTWKTIVDNTAPSAPSIIAPTDEQYFNSTPILDNWTDSTDANGIDHYQVEYIYDDGHTFSGGPYRETPGNQSQRNHTPGSSEQGGVKIRVRAIDNAGNVGNWSNQVHYYYDATAPSTPTNGLPNGTYEPDNEFDFTWNASTDNIGPVTYEYQASQNPSESGGVLNTGLWHSGILSANTIHSSGAPDGVWYWQVRAKDAAGNYSPWSAIWDMTIDSQAPNVTINSYAAVSNVITPDVTATDPTPSTALSYKWTANDAASASDVAVSDDTALEPDFTANADGTYSFTLTVTDAAGNSTAKVFSFTYAAPVVPPSLIGGRGTNAGAANTGGFTAVTTNTPGGAATPQAVPAAGVLGAQTDNTDNSNKNESNKSDKGVLGDSTDKDSCSKLLGICWYYWVPIVVVIAGIVYYFFRRRQTSEV